MVGEAMPGLAAAVVVGGASRRMGKPKAFLELAGTTLIEHVLVVLRQLTDKIFLVGGDAVPYARFGLPHHGDVLPGGALAGIHSAVYHSGRPLTLVVACDMPFLNAPLLQAMAASARSERYDIVVPTVAGYPQGLHAIYGRQCLAPIERRLRADQRKVISFYPDVRVDYWDEGRWRKHDAEGQSFVNVNTPAELAAARADAPRP